MCKRLDVCEGGLDASYITRDMGPEERQLGLGRPQAVRSDCPAPTKRARGGTWGDEALGPGEGGAIAAAGEAQQQQMRGGVG